MIKRTFLALLLFVCCATMARPVSASTVRYRTDAELIARSERVVHGRVVAQRTTWDGPAKRTIYTVTTLAVLEDFTGQPGDTVEMWELGGTVGNEFMYVGGGVHYQLGEDVIVCLERGPRGLRSVAMNLSRFTVSAGTGAEAMLTRSLANTDVAGGQPVLQRTVSAFRQLASQVTGRPSLRHQVVEPQQQKVQGVEDRFTKLGGEPGYRWLEADSSFPVTFYRNTSAPTPLLTGDSTTEIQTALSAWTAPTTGSIVLQYGGTVFESSAKGPWSNLFGPVGLITYEDPNNEIDNDLSGETLAIGGGFGFQGEGGQVNGTTFNGFIRAYVIFQNAADMDPQFRQSLNFTRVLTHELGHAIGFGHTQQDGSIPNPTANIMYASCCTASTPTPPALGPDDLAALAAIYPASPANCTYTLGAPSATATAAGGSSTVTVTTQNGCAWTAVSNNTFLDVTSGSNGNGSGTVGYAVDPNTGAAQRSGSLLIAGQTFTITQAGTTGGPQPCTYTLTPTSATAGSAGGAATVTVTTQVGCAWTAASNALFLTITSGASGSGSGTVGYSVAGNGATERTGTLTIAAQTFTVTQAGTLPSMTVDKTALAFGATLNGSTVTAQTSAQIVRLTQSGSGTVTWTATSNQPWLVVSPTSGSGTKELSITVAPANFPAIGTHTGTITLALVGAGNSVGPIAVTLSNKIHGTSANPFGTVDTPANNATGVTGAIPFTGWALDDIEVTRAVVCRAAFGSETAPVDPNCAGQAQIYVGDAVFIDGARPDVQASFPGRPRDSRAGWGFMVLTNMLPAQGNGVYQFYMHAFDREGHTLLLGTRTITCNNAAATKPFGAIDTPTQGGTASGDQFVNFGWALTQASKIIPIDGSTIQVLVDGAVVGTADYNHYRPDIANTFPGLQNSNGAIGFRILNTTLLANGLHTISWIVTDSGAVTEGIGSRFFLVSNGAGALTAASGESRANRGDLVAQAAAVAAAPRDTARVIGRRGWDLEGAWHLYAADASGRTVIRGEEVDRVELQLGETSGQSYTGYLRVGGALAPLPAGSQLNASTGWFTWAPGVGFIGTYDLVFVRWAGTRAVAKQDVRVILAPKGSSYIGVQVEIDTLRSSQSVAQPFLVGGWAADLDSAAGAGIDTLHVWAYPVAGGPPVFLGTPALGGVRPDVASIHGDRFREAGFGLVVDGLPAGTYDLAVFPWSNVIGGFAPPKTVRVTVQ